MNFLVIKMYKGDEGKIKDENREEGQRREFQKVGGVEKKSRQG